MYIYIYIYIVCCCCNMLPSTVSICHLIVRMFPFLVRTFPLIAYAVVRPLMISYTVTISGRWKALN